MSRARTLAGAIGSDGTLNVSDVGGLAAVASSGSATDLTTGTLPIARIADSAITNAKLASTGFDASKLTTGTLPNARLATGAAAANLGFTPPNFAPVSTLALIGGYTNGTWYPIWDSSTLSSTGMYIIDFYAATYNAGGGMYGVSGVSVPFHFYAGGTNSADIQTIAVHQTGHALGGNSIALRTRTTYNNVGVTYIEMQYNGGSLSGMNSSISGKECILYVRRLY